jgi:hypothetical protein
MLHRSHLPCRVTRIISRGTREEVAGTRWTSLGIHFRSESRKSGSEPLRTGADRLYVPHQLTCRVLHQYLLEPRAATISGFHSSPIQSPGIQGTSPNGSRFNLSVGGSSPKLDFDPTSVPASPPIPTMTRRKRVSDRVLGNVERDTRGYRVERRRGIVSGQYP